MVDVAVQVVVVLDARSAFIISNRNWLFRGVNDGDQSENAENRNRSCGKICFGCKHNKIIIN